MTTIIKLLIASILACFLSSCNWGVQGNGNVKTVERSLNETFDEIEISGGLDVYLTQSDTERIKVQADENLHDIIKTKIEGNVLKIYAEETITFSEAHKVMDNFKNVSKISASSGSDVFSTNTLNTESITLMTKSGSDMTLKINAQSIDCSAFSGSDLTLSGTSKTIKATAESGSDIDARNLITETSHVDASSGADIKVNSSKELYANATMGGDINYRGNPGKVDKNDSTAGSVKED